MKLCKRWLPALVMAAALISASLTVPSAASGYTCTETDLKVPDHFSTKMMVQKDGGLDSFWIDRGDGPEEGKPYLYHSQDGGKTWAAQDTGWLSQCADQYAKVVNPYDKLLDRDYTDVTWDAGTTGPDGSLYHTTRQGVFALKPDASSFTQIMDASTAHLGTEMRQIVDISAGHKGDLYAVTAYCNEKNPDDPKNGTQLKLLHYTPQ